MLWLLSTAPHTDLPMHFRAGLALPVTVPAITSMPPPDPSGSWDGCRLPPRGPLSHRSSAELCSGTHPCVPGLAGCIPASSSPASQGTMPLCQHASGPSCGTRASGASCRRADSHRRLFSTSVARKRTLSSAKGIRMKPPQFFSPVICQSRGTHTAATPQHPPSHLRPYLVHLWHGGATGALPFHNHHVPDAGYNLPISWGPIGPGAHRVVARPTYPLLLSTGCCHPSPPPDKYSIVLHVGKEAPQEV